jgi:hypothetical protein
MVDFVLAALIGWGWIIWEEWSGYIMKICLLQESVYCIILR